MTLPLTLLSGPSPVLRDRLVEQLLARRQGLVAVVHDLAELQARGVVRRRVLDTTGVLEDERVPLARGCVSCSLREDLLPALVRVSQVGRWQEVVLALPVPSLPDGVADVLRRGLVANEGLVDHVRLDGVTTVVDAVQVHDQLSEDDLLSELGLAAATTDRRSVAELIAGQIEQADVLALVHLDRVAPQVARTVQTLLTHLAPLALQVPLSPDGKGCEALVTTGRAGGTGTADRTRLSLLAHELLAPAHGVSTLVWRSDRPLHAERVHAALEHLVAPVQRGRGHVQLADRPRQVLLWESAGPDLSLGVLADTHTSVPCCELVLTGMDLDTAVLGAHLDRCVVTDAELAQGLRSGPDPFYDALGDPAITTDALPG